MRGRGRKGPNPLTRSYESNGPDVKIRGTAQHIADKYQQLARDAQASGDRIMSENYLQHAEHYLRIIAAAQPQQPVQQPRVDQDESADTPSSAAAAPPSDERTRPERGERPKPASNDLMDEDSPQPFIEDMPTIDGQGQVNGHAVSAGGEDTSKGDGDADKPRRRTRMPRGRPVRRTADDQPESSGDLNEAGADGGSAADDTASAAAGDEESAAKPKTRRAPRTRRVKKADEAPDSETVAIGD
ncbi:MAG: DUF4167 domain-containing protein [Roseibium sp.]|nr:DUF4167 domain-containing protein [Roseibium sp.]